MTLSEQFIEFFSSSPLVFMKTIPFKEVVFDDRAKYMCKFGCKNYGRKFSCPPNSLALAEKIKNNKFKWALLVATSYPLSNELSRFQRNNQNLQREMEIQRISTQLDNLMNLYEINHIVLSGGACKKCRECSLIKNQMCKKPHQKLTSMEAVGIDCQKTLHYAGFDFEMPNYNSINRCAAVLLNEDDISSINIQKIESFQKYNKPNKNSAENSCSQLLEKYPKLFERIEIRTISDLEKENSICTEHCRIKNFSCPPYSGKIELDLWDDFILWEWKKSNIKKYSYNIALRKIHSTFFSMGFYFAMSLRDCYCDECIPCTFLGTNKTICNYRKLLSPSMQSQGIDPISFGKGKFGIELL
jgi:predicted metal-binding protein